MHSRACDPRQLDVLLHQWPSEEVSRELEAHLLICPACRNKLDEMAGGTHWWTEVRKYLGSDGASELSPTSDAAVSPDLGDIDLGFLQPSDNPTSLGRLGAYEILEVLGKGGMGIVLKGFDPALHRPVAIKVLAAEYAANGSARKRFAREAQAAAAVIHDHVVPVHAVDANATPPYLVMALIAGRSLQQRLDQSGPLELKEILRIGMQTAAGLVAAHAQGLVHRDIKPANIMLENGIERVRITDFGLARAVDDASVTQNGVLTGTPQYMAPEQARGEPVDQRADLFSLGSTLYAMCTGRSPFWGNSTAAAVRQVCDVEPKPIRSINPDIPAWLEGIIRKLHAKNPAQRFQSAAQVAELFEQCLAHVHQPDQRPLPRLAEELARQVTDRKSYSLSLPKVWGRLEVRFWRALGAAALLLAFLGGMSWLFSHLGKPAETATETSAAELVPEINPELLGFWDEGSEQIQIGNRLGRLEQSFFAPSFSESEGMEADLHWLGQQADRLRCQLDARFSEPVGMEADLNWLRQQADSLRRQLDAGSESEFESVSMQMEIIRRRLDLLKQDLDRRRE